MKNDRVWPFALLSTLGLILLEPALERNPPLEKLSELETAKQYLAVCPTAEVVHFFPRLGKLKVSVCGIFGIVLIIVAALGILSRFQNKRLNRLGIYLIGLSASELGLEYLSRKEFYLGSAQLRYMAIPGLGMGLFLLARDRMLLAALNICAFIWDISSAIYWAIRENDIFVRLPVPYWGRLDQEGEGAPAIVPIIVDLLGLVFGIMVAVSKWDPLGLFAEPPAED